MRKIKKIISPQIKKAPDSLSTVKKLAVSLIAPEL